MSDLMSSAVVVFESDHYPDGAVEDANLATIFEDENLDKATVQKTFALAGASGNISLSDHTDAQWILLNWDDEDLISNAERFATVMLYGALNEMARDDAVDTEFVMSLDELFQPVTDRIETGYN
jgi:hypothetical protein